MARKYIQGKDGKFKGSLPSMGSAPAGLPVLPSKIADFTVPTATEASYHNLAAEYAAKKKAKAEFPLVDETYEEAGEIYYGSSLSSELEGNLTYDEGAYVATVISNFDEGSEYLEEEFFVDRAAAETWLKEAISERLTPMREFTEGWENNRIAFLHDLEAECEAKDINETIYVSGGYPAAKIVGSGKYGGKVNYYDDDQYSVVIVRYEDIEDGESWEPEGSEFLVHSVPTFEEGLNFVRYFAVRG